MSTAVTKPSTLQQLSLIAEREIRARLRSKTFLVSTGIIVAIVLAVIVLPALFADSSQTKVAAFGPSATAALERNPGLEQVTASSAAEAEALVRSKDVSAAVIDDAAAPAGFKLVTLSEIDSNLTLSLSVQPEVVVLEPVLDNYWLAYIVAIGFGAIFMASAMTFGGSIATSVVEEKQTRIVEILLTTVSARTLLFGKVVGNTLLAFGQIAIVGAAAGIALSLTNQGELLAAVGAPILWFVLFFTLGFVLLASMFAALAALVSRAEDVQSAIAPVTYLLMVPYVMVIIAFNKPDILSIMSYVPFSAPVGMPMRLFLGQADWWEPLLSLAILIVSAIVIVSIGAKIYENSLLKTGGRVKLTEALRNA